MEIYKQFYLDCQKEESTWFLASAEIDPKGLYPKIQAVTQKYFKNLIKALKIAFKAHKNLNLDACHRRSGFKARKFEIKPSNVEVKN